MADRAAIFIDGAYLDRVRQDEFNGVRLNFQRMADVLTPDSSLLRAYYYDCPPYQDNPPSADQRNRYQERRKFFTALNRLPRFEVRLGRLERRQGPDGRPRFEQKRVDILLGVDMVQLAAKQRIEQAILITGDSDFIPAISVAKSEGVLVRLFHGDNCHSELWQEVDERVKFTQEFIDSVRL